jgi:hypothetical protein
VNMSATCCSEVFFSSSRGSHLPCNDHVSDKVAVHLDMFCALMEDWIRCNESGLADWLSQNMAEE